MRPDRVRSEKVSGQGTAGGGALVLLTKPALGAESLSERPESALAKSN